MMHVRASMLMGLAVLAASASQGSAAKPDPKAIRKSVGPAVCTVTVENEWGTPQSVSTGWLLGKGRFVVTDLGALKVRGAARATLRFNDGATATAKSFGMADPALGLAVLRVDEKEPERKGLALAAELPTLGRSTDVATAGYDWGERFDVATGLLLPGPKIETVASRSGVKPPEGIDRFLRIEGKRLHAASGSPVTDADGQVLAVRLDVKAKRLTAVLAMPATTLRSSLLSAKPELKPLSELPDPSWPVRVLRLPGEPTVIEDFAEATHSIRQALVCDRCKGKGTIKVVGRRLGGSGLYYPFPHDVQCPCCHGTGIDLTPEIMGGLLEWARQGTRVSWAPEMDRRTRGGVRKIGVEVLTRLATVGRHVTRKPGRLGKVDATEPKPGDSRGILLYAQVTDKVKGPDGPYLVLDVCNTRTPVAVRVEDLLGYDGLGPHPGRQAPAKGAWFVMAATVVSAFDTGVVDGVYVLPFEWVPYNPELDSNERRDDRQRGQPRWRRR